MEYGRAPVDTLSFKQWQTGSGKDRHSLFSDPGFKGPKQYDFHLRNTFTIRQIGFVPFDYKKAGVTGDEQWKKSAILPDNIIREFDKSVQKIMLD